MNEQFDICIIGAGVIGLSIAERLSRSYSNILVIEKESSFGQHVSSRNSEVIHSGFYYPKNSLKAKLCVKGNKMMYDFAKKYSINHKNCGKLIVDSSVDSNKLLKLMDNAQKNGLKDVKILNETESKAIEERVKCKSSLWIPTAGIIDSHGLMAKLENISISNNVSIIYNTLLTSINKT
jgi:L-2-hydroxyglutarate oxidase LhgO